MEEVAIEDLARLYKALGNQVKALTTKKKEKENVLIDMELVNLKHVSIGNNLKTSKK